MDDLILRPATLDDAPLLSRLHIQAWRETYPGLLPARLLASLDTSPDHDPVFWRGALARPRHWTIVAEVAGPVGFCQFGASDARGGAYPGAIERLYLLDRAHGLGLGRRLMAEAAATLAAHGLVPFALRVLDGNRRAQRFYEGLGGRRLDRRVAFAYEGQPIFEIAYGWDDAGALAAAPSTPRSVRAA